MFTSRFMPCPECGASVDRSSMTAHECAPDRLADYQLFRLREGVDALEADVRRWLTMPSGRFETWLAARKVREAH